ncbi:hypothetical protein D3C76_1067870 [compost metagenome]
MSQYRLFQIISGRNHSAGYCADPFEYRTHSIEGINNAVTVAVIRRCRILTICSRRSCICNDLLQLIHRKGMIGLKQQCSKRSCMRACHGCSVPASLIYSARNC